MVPQLWSALESDTADRQPLTQVATWCIGEFGDLLLTTSGLKVIVNSILFSYILNNSTFILIGNSIHIDYEEQV